MFFLINRRLNRLIKKFPKDRGRCLKDMWSFCRPRNQILELQVLPFRGKQYTRLEEQSGEDLPKC